MIKHNLKLFSQHAYLYIPKLSRALQALQGSLLSQEDHKASLMEYVLVLACLVPGLMLALPKLTLALATLRADTRVPCFNVGLALCMASAGELLFSQSSCSCCPFYYVAPLKPVVSSGPIGPECAAGTVG